MSTALAVMVALASARKAGQLYPATHPEHIDAINSLVAAVDEATAAGAMTLNVHQGRLYHQSSLLPEDTPSVHAIEEAFEVRRVESMTLHPGFGAADAQGLVDVLSMRASSSFDFEGELASHGVTAVSIALLADDDEEREERDRLREQDRALYHRLLSVLRKLSNNVAQGGEPDLAQAEGMVGNIMGRLLEDQSAVIGLATIRGHSEADLFHSINVMIYALTLGSTLGLPEEGLSSLGLCALMHDVGKAAFDHSDPGSDRRHARDAPQDRS